MLKFRVMRQDEVSKKDAATPGQKNELPIIGYFNCCTAEYGRFTIYAVMKLSYHYGGISGILVVALQFPSNI